MRQRHDVEEAIKIVAKTYRDQGFSFHSPPTSRQLPSSLGSYVPPAIAIKGDKKVVIEVRLNHDRATNPRLTDIREKLAGQKGWRLDVIYAPRSIENEIVIEAASSQAIHDQLAEVSALSNEGHKRPAFMLGWSLLEAAFATRNVSSEASQVQTPAQLVQSLAMNGHIGAATDSRLRELVPLCVRITHGDLTAVPSDADLRAVTEAVEETLAAAA
jgi:hypothetical protein